MTEGTRPCRRDPRPALRLRRSLAALAAAGLACLPLGCAPGPAGDVRPNVLFVLVDALRADALGAYGASPSRTPALDRLAGRGFVFRRAYSNAPKTVPSVASLFTATPPWVHRIEAGPGQEVEGLSYLSDRLVLAPEVLDEYGYWTGMITTTGWITPEVNYDQGVDEYVLTERADAAVIEAAEGFIARHAEERFFAYVHLLDLHDYYHAERLFAGPDVEEAAISQELRALADASPSAVYRRLRTEPERFTAADAAFLRRAYDRELEATDRMIGRLLAALEANGVLDETVVVVTSDHGEQFLEHGRLVHGGNGLYDEVLRVPLVIAGPGVEPGAVEEPVGSVDVFPTLFDLLGIEAPEEFMGRSALAEPRAESEGGPHAVVATSGSAWKLVTGRWSYILSEKYDREELYDLAEDPGERHDLAAERPAVRDELRRLLAREIRRGQRHPYLTEVGEVERVPLSEDVEETLRSLGYLE